MKPETKIPQLDKYPGRYPRLKYLLNVVDWVRAYRRDPVEFPPADESVVPPVQYVSQDMVDDVLSKRGSNFSDGKYRIYSYFRRFADKTQRADFLKREYGIGGSFTGRRNVESDSKGLFISGGMMNRESRVMLTWPQVAKRIDELIRDGAYMSRAELDHCPVYEREQIARSILNFFIDKLVSDDEQIFVYVTIWSLGEGTATADEYMVAHIQDRDDFDSFEQYVDQLQLFAEKSSEYQFVSVRNALIDEKKQELSDTKTIINMIETLLFVVTGFCIMGIVFFSVKERIPEIGIKKSLGAGRADILFQFVFEMMLISVIVSFFAAFCAFMCCKFLEGFISEKLLILFTVRVGLADFLSPILFGVLETMVSSLIPGIYASSIKVTEALKFE